MNKLKISSEKLKEWGRACLPAGRWKVLVLSLVAQLTISSLLHIGLKAPQFLSFLAVPNIQVKPLSITSQLPFKLDIFESIKPKLRQKTSDFLLQGQSVTVAGEFNQSNAYLVINLNNGEILVAKDINVRVPIASLTKLMTAVVALDLAQPEEVFTVSDRATVIQPTRIGVVAGERMTLDELLYAAMLTSANDAVEVIKEGIDQKYGERVFIKAMNAKAEVLWLKNTHFSNPQGLDNPRNYSSAEDLAILSHYALTNYPKIAEITQKDYHFLPPDENHKQFDLYNWNGLLGVYPGVKGIKIGNTGDAGYTTIVVSEREGHKLVVVLLGVPGVIERDLWASELLDRGFEKLGLEPVRITEGQLIEKYSTWQ